MDLKMKKGTSVYLWLIIIVFILILIPYFQNAWGGGSWISFYFMSVSGLTSIYLYIISLGIIEWVLITLYIISLLKDIKEDEPTKFSLNW